MNFQIRKRHILILAIATAQAICLCWGVFVFNSWLRSSVREIVHEQVLADNVQTAKQMTTLICQMDVTDLRQNKDSWLKLQHTIRDIRLPNKGYVCIVDASDGELICHPALKRAPQSLINHLTKTPQQGSPAASKQPMAKPMMVKSKMAKPEMAKNDMTEPAMRKPKMAGQQLATGEPAMTKKKGMELWQQDVPGYTTAQGDQLEIIAAEYIPELDANVNVHQKTSGIEWKISKIMKPVVPLGIIVSLSLVIGSTLVICEILRRYENRLARINENLEDLVDQRTQALKETRDAVIFGLAKLAESRDTDTGEHLDRIRIYVTILAKHLGQRFKWIDEQYIANLGLASSLHDIGKVAIPDNILLKPGRFEPEERKVMETHAERGGECLQAIGERLGENDFLQLSRDIAFAHHEKWDGSGYPFQVSGESIPLSARIVALADVYDALRSRRPYKDPMPHEKAKQIILEGDGSHFDPQLVEAFLACEEEFQSVSGMYAAATVGPEGDKEPALAEA